MLNVFEMPLFSLIFRWQPRFRLVKHVYYSLAFSYIIRICISYTHECRVCGIRVHLKWISPMYSASQAVCNQIYRCVDIMSHCHGTLPVCRTPAIHCCIARNMCTLTVARYTGQYVTHTKRIRNTGQHYILLQTHGGDVKNASPRKKKQQTKKEIILETHTDT